mmetsp:Transcript_56884/g.130221  ORF Transcript_56884/g.130221 Transcript_56884/m.130221 type:complete len:210 (+) Transcript_56884:1707-2336(+)
MIMCRSTPMNATTEETTATGSGTRKATPGRSRSRTRPARSAGGPTSRIRMMRSLRTSGTVPTRQRMIATHGSTATKGSIRGLRVSTSGTTRLTTGDGRTSGRTTGTSRTTTTTYPAPPSATGRRRMWMIAKGFTRTSQTRPRRTTLADSSSTDLTTRPLPRTTTTLPPLLTGRLRRAPTGGELLLRRKEGRRTLQRLLRARRSRQRGVW